MILTEDERQTLVLVAAGQELPGVGIAMPDRAGVCDRRDEQAGRHPSGGVAAHRGQVAVAVVARRLEGLVDEPRPGAPRTITDEQVEAVVVATLEETPEKSTHWSRASMAKRSGLSKSTVGRIWKAFRLKPHLTERFKLSSDPQFVEKVRDVGGAVPGPTRAGAGAVRGREVAGRRWTGPSRSCR